MSVNHQQKYMHYDPEDRILTKNVFYVDLKLFTCIQFDAFDFNVRNKNMALFHVHYQILMNVLTVFILYHCNVV